jgi:hypothetical protein
MPDYSSPLGLSREQIYRATEAKIKVLNTCLANIKATHRFPIGTNESPPDIMAGRYGPVNNIQAKRGYHFMAAISNGSATRDRQSASSDEKEALDECQHHAADVIPDANVDGLTDKIKAESYVKSISLPAVSKSFARWSACMADAGFIYASPEDPMRDRKWDWKTDEPTSEEVKTAHRDVLCKKRADVVAAWFDGESSLERADIKRNNKALESVAAKIRRKEEAVRRVLETDGRATSRH